MKRLLVLLFMLIVVTVQGQDSLKVELTPKGLFFEGGKEYVVLNYEGKSTQELYESFLSAINDVYFLGKDVVSKVEGKSIAVSALQTDAIIAKRLRNPKFSYDITYSLTILFKAGKVRFNIPEIQKINAGENKLIISGEKSFWKSTQPIYDKKGKLRFTLVKESIEDFFNIVLNSIIKTRQSQQDW